MTFGLTPSGFRRKRLETIKNEIEQAFIDEFGEDVNLEPDSVTSQIIGIFAEREAQLWELSERVYFSQWLATAEGTQLDNVARLIGVTRLEPAPSNVTGAFIGDRGTTIPVGTQVSTEEEGDIFETVQEKQISRNSVLRTKIEVTNVVEGFEYRVIVNSLTASYTSQTGDTEQDILENLRAEVNALNTTIDIQASIENSELIILSEDGRSDFSIDVSDNLGITEIATPILMNSQEDGPIPAPQGTLTVIETPVSGLDEVTNFADAILGNELEKDVDFRLRIGQSLRILGKATPESIRAQLIDRVAGVTRAIVFENRTDEVDSEGRPPHSFETLVVGGEPLDIANEIWDVKPAGIETFGNISRIITDSTGCEHEISFSRPEDVIVWVQVDIEVISGQFPSDGSEQIKENIVEFAEDEIDIGDDILYQRLFQPVYRVPGVTNATVKLATGSTEPSDSSFTADNIQIANTEQSLFDTTRIEVTIV